MQCAVGTCGTEGAWHRRQPLFLLPDVREMTPFGREELAFLRSAGFYLTRENPFVVLLELIPGYLICLLEFWELAFPLVLTFLPLLMVRGDAIIFAAVIRSLLEGPRKSGMLVKGQKREELQPMVRAICQKRLVCCSSLRGKEQPRRLDWFT